MFLLRSLISRYAGRYRGAGDCRRVIGLSVAFRRQVIAEGVETDDHGSLLIQLGCDLAQGYGIAHPMPPEQIPAWIAGWTAPQVWTDQ